MSLFNHISFGRLAVLLYCLYLITVKKQCVSATTIVTAISSSIVPKQQKKYNNKTNKRWCNTQYRQETTTTIPSKVATTSSNSNSNRKNHTASTTIRNTTCSIQKFQYIQQFLNKNFFLIGLLFTLCISKLYPNLGTDHSILHPELYIGRYGVEATFILSGLSVEMNQLIDTISNIKLIGMIQCMIFIFWPLFIGIPIHYYIRHLPIFSNPMIQQPIMDGILILSCLPTSVNMCIIMTGSSNGNIATAVFNTVLSNLLGIIVTPIWLYQFFGTIIELQLHQMFYKLSKKVLIPVIIGQFILKRISLIENYYNTHKSIFKRMSEIILLSILWNAFCNAITQNMIQMNIRDTIILLLIISFIHLSVLRIMFLVYSNIQLSKPDVIAAMFCSSQKTLAFGLPLIHTLFESNPNIAYYTAPLMCIHPLQLLLGSFFISKLQRYVKEDDDDDRTVVEKNAIHKIK